MAETLAPGDPLLADETGGEDEDFGFDAAAADPWEPANRVFFGVNEFLDTILFHPLTEAYQFAVPAPGRRGVRRLFLNLNSPSVLVNDLLQLRFRNAATTAGRLVLNTAFGAGGIFDVAKEAGWNAHHADFGQTLALIGVHSGPYLVIPILGPSTVRDGFGDAVDRTFQPLTYLLGPVQQLVLTSGNGLTVYDENADQLEALESSSVDFYAALRSAYLQNRKAQIWSATAVDAGVAAKLASAH